MNKDKIFRAIGVTSLCIVIIGGIPYVVWGLYLIGERFWGIPTFLNKTEMLSYLTSILGAVATTFIGIIALRQTQRLDDMSRAPNIVISEVANDPFYKIAKDNEEKLEKLCSYVHKADPLCGKTRLSFRFQILEKSVEEISIYNLTIYQIEKNTEKEILKLPDSNIPDGMTPFLQANSQVLVCYSTDILNPGKTYKVAFFTKCKTMDGYWYKRKCHMFLTYSIYDHITVRPIEGSSWEKIKKGRIIANG